MLEKRTQNILLAIVATLLLLNLGAMLSPVAHAVPQITKPQYQAVRANMNGGHGDASAVQQVLDQKSAQGWEYVGSTEQVLIFKNPHGQ